MSLAAQGIIFAAMFSVGLLIGVWSDLIKTLTAKRPKYLIACGDLFFWFSVATLVILVLFNLNYLELRFYSFVSALLGNWVYYKILSKYISRYYRWQLKITVLGCKHFVRLAKPVTLPLRIIAQILDGFNLLLIVGIANIVFKIQDFFSQGEDITPSM